MPRLPTASFAPLKSAGFRRKVDRPYWNVKGEEPRLRLDFKHANTSGCYLAGLVWYEALTGNDAREIKYAPRGVKEADAPFLREVAHDVLQRRPAGDQGQ